LPSFLICCHILKWALRKQSKNADYFAHHKIAVGVEKIGDKIQFFVFDNNREFEAKNVHLNPGPFNETELLSSHIQSVLFPEESTTFFKTTIKRQFGRLGGCTVFALRDAIGFLEDPQFFDKITKGIKGTGGKLLEPYFIDHLPPNFVKYMQSISKIKDFMISQPDCVPEKLGKAQRTLEENLKHHTVKFEGEDRNMHIQQRLLKYQMLVIMLLKAFAGQPQVINQLINKHFLSIQ